MMDHIRNIVSLNTDISRARKNTFSILKILFLFLQTPVYMFATEHIPGDHTVKVGRASVSKGPTTVVETKTTRTAIEWASFNLSANKKVEFIVPSHKSTVLNNITSSSPSFINGSISSRNSAGNVMGTILFANPNGIIIGLRVVLM